MKKKWIVAALAACAIALAGCRAVSESSSVAVESVTLNAETLTLEPGKTRKLMATVTPSNADDKTVAWSSSSADVATVDSNGTVTAYKVGTTTITAQAGGKQATCLVTVKSEAAVTQPPVKPEPVAVESVTLSAPTLTIEPGKTRNLVATVKPGNADDKAVTWLSSNVDVATVENDGTVTAHTEGTATITAKAGGKEATCTVTVKRIEIAVNNVTLDKTTLTLTRGEKGKLSAKVTPDNADDTSVAWSSSDADIATVDNDGTVTANKAGTATITAQAGDIKAECAVTVNPILVASVALDTAALTLTCGETGKLTATVMPDNADDKTVKWSSSDTSVAKVGDDGTITAVSKGTATITAKAGGKQATCAVTVKQPVENVALDITAVTLEPSMTRKLTATVKPDNADDKTLKWSSSDTSVATVGNDGTVTAVKAGTATIVAQSGDKQATCLVTVRTGHTYIGGKCTICGAKPYLKDGEIDDNGVLTKYSGSEATVAIPDGVTKIAGGAFYSNKSLEHVTIPDSVTSIADGVRNSNVSFYYYGAFGECTNLKTVTMVEGITSIGSYAFRNCSGLKSVTIPDSVTSIGADAFYGCKGLTSVEIPDSVTSIEASAFESCTSLTSVTIPNSVTRIGGSAFCGCKGLERVEIPDSVTSIGAGAFYECYGLTNVVISNGVTSIGESAFYKCTSLKSITIPGSVKNIGDGRYPEIGGVFEGCENLNKVTIYEGVTYIGKRMFATCTNLASVNYTGTEAKWNAITKGEEWDSDTGSYTITYNYKE